MSAPSLPLFGLRGTVLFPRMRCEIRVVTERELAILRAARPSRDGKQIAVFTLLDESTINPDPDDLYRVGTIANVVNVSQRPCCGTWVAELRASHRIRAHQSLRCLGEASFPWVRATPIQESEENPAALFGVTSAIRQAATQIAALAPDCVHVLRTMHMLREHVPAAEFPGAVGELLLHVDIVRRQMILELEPLSLRLEETLCELHALLVSSRCSTPWSGRCIHEANDILCSD